MKTPAITLTDVTKHFGSHAALDRVSLDVASAEAAVILGPSGCGKTTLLRVVAGLEIPETGEVVLSGTPVGAAGRTIIPPHQRKIGFVFQDLALWPHLTVLQNLDFVLGSGGVARSERKRRGQESLALVRAGLFADRYPHQLSGGEQQRVALARALVGTPQTLLLDEPLSSLDRDLRAELRSEIGRLHRELCFTMLYVTHDREDAAALADRVIEMRGGRILRTQRIRTLTPPQERA